MSDIARSGGIMVCNECGSANEPDTKFCGACGTYLGWDGERVAPEEPQLEVVPDVVAEPEKPTLMDRVRAGLGLEAEGRTGPGVGRGGPQRDPGRSRGR